MTVRTAVAFLVAFGAPDLAAQTPATGAFAITNFASGPVCRDPALVDERRDEGNPPSDHICAGTDVPIRGEDGCIWSGEHRRCTWYGWEFDYEHTDPDVPIVCVWTRSHPGNQGNREGIQSRGLATDTVEIPLPAESGHFFSPGYDLYQPVTFPWGIVRLGYDCTYKGAPAFQASFRLIYSSAFR